MRIEPISSDEVRSAIGRLGRTEDVHFSPDNRRLAIAGMLQNRILVLDVEIDLTLEAGRIAFTDHLEITSPSLSHPHGLFWIDNHTLIVANRNGEAPILKVPVERPASKVADLVPLHTIRADDIGMLKTPGSVSVSHIGLDLYEVLICNGFSHYISQHVLDGRTDFSVVANSIVLSSGLNVPDGVAYSDSARWIAVSNHYDHSVFLYKNGPGLDRQTKPCGTLHGVTYPHGVRFTKDERFVLVADAGAPFVHVYASDEGDWCVEHEPIAAIQVVDDATFIRGNYNPEEGGPKGIDIDSRSEVLVATCEEVPLVFFDIRDIVKGAWKGTPNHNAGDRETELARGALLGDLAFAQSALRSTQGELREARRTSQENGQQAEALRGEIQAMLNSRSWRTTLPLRWLSTAARKFGQVLRTTRSG